MLRVTKKISIRNNHSQVNAIRDLPTLKSYPVIGHSYLFLPGGKYKSDRLTEAFVDISGALGPIFKLNLAGKDMVVSLDADHARILFRSEGPLPVRPPFPALLHYRKKIFHSSGVVPGNGQEWSKFRKGVNILLTKPTIEAYKPQQKEIAKIFIEYIKEKRDDNFIMKNMYAELMKFTIEAISVVSPGHRFQAIFNKTDEVNYIIKANIDFMDGLYRTFSEPPVWRFWKTAGYKKLESSHNTIYHILRKHLDKAKEEYQNNSKNMKENNPYMHSLFSNETYSWDDINMLAMEVFLGGIDATATTIAFTLHYFAHNPNIQELARKNINDWEFLRSCIKETLRLSPTAGGNARVLAADAKMSNYLLPKGTLILSCNSAISQDCKYFEKCKDYYPQRWMRATREQHHRFASLPFGLGPRMCPGKRIAESEIIFLLQEILKNFSLEAVGSRNVGMVYRMNRVPDQPINIKFVDRNH